MDITTALKDVNHRIEKTQERLDDLFTTHKEAATSDKNISELLATAHSLIAQYEQIERELTRLHAQQKVLEALI